MSVLMEGSNFEQLRGSIAGHVSLPREPDWDEARLAWNLAADQLPVAVALPESAQDVIAVVQFALEHDLRIAAQATGHGAAALDSLAGTILLKGERMRGLEIDSSTSRARVEAGTVWGEVAAAAAKHGLAGLSGSSPDVGVLGYTLGGGMSWMARKHGLACNHVVAADIVTADGRLHRIDAQNETDLFWAIRGGGGSFGAVTALEFSLQPVERLYAGSIFWPMEQAPRILHAWREWTADLPVELTSLGRLLRVPPLPDIPEPFRGRALVGVEAAFLGDESTGRRLLAPLRDLEPEVDTFSMIAPPGLAALHMDPPEPVPGTGNGFNLRELPLEALDAVIETAGADSGSPLLSFELRQLGGALAETDPNAGALPNVEAAFTCFGVAMTPDPASQSAARAALDKLERALEPWAATQEYANFIERPGDSARFFSSEIFERLRQIKAARDPRDIFQSNHPVPPA